MSMGFLVDQAEIIAGPCQFLDIKFFGRYKKGTGQGTQGYN
jgi:hypothetical protein